MAKYYFVGEYGYGFRQLLPFLERQLKNKQNKITEIATWETFCIIINLLFPHVKTTNVETIMGPCQEQYRNCNRYENQSQIKLLKRNMFQDILALDPHKKNFINKGEVYSIVKKKITHGEQFKDKKYISVFPRFRKVRDSKNNITIEHIEYLKNKYPNHEIIGHGLLKERIDLGIRYVEDIYEQINVFNNSEFLLSPASGLVDFALACGCSIVLTSNYPNLEGTTIHNNYIKNWLDVYDTKTNALILNNDKENINDLNILCEALNSQGCRHGCLNYYEFLKKETVGELNNLIKDIVVKEKVTHIISFYDEKTNDKLFGFLKDVKKDIRHIVISNQKDNKIQSSVIENKDLVDKYFSLKNLKLYKNNNIKCDGIYYPHLKGFSKIENSKKNIEISYIKNFNLASSPIYKQNQEIVQFLKSSYKKFYMVDLQKSKKENIRLANNIYNSSKIVINLNNLDSDEYKISPNIINAMASGAMVITKYSLGLENYFTNGEHLCFFKNKEQLKTLIDFYLENNEKRIEIANNGYKFILDRFSYISFVKDMLGQE